MALLLAAADDATWPIKTMNIHQCLWELQNRWPEHTCIASMRSPNPRNICQERGPDSLHGRACEQRTWLRSVAAMFQALQVKAMLWLSCTLLRW